jgi:hypothetical protein
LTTWLLVIGSLIGILAGASAGSLGFWLHHRSMNNVSLPLKAIPLVLLGMPPRTRQVADEPVLPDETIVAAASVPLDDIPTADASVLADEMPVTAASVLADEAPVTAVSILPDDTPLSGLDPAAATPAPPGDTEPPEPALPQGPDSAMAGLVDLFQEFDANAAALANTAAGRASELSVAAWQKCQRLISELPPEIRDDVDSIYADIALLNNLAWITTEFDRRSPELVQTYNKLGLSVVARMHRVKTAYGKASVPETTADARPSPEKRGSPVLAERAVS